MHLFKLCMYFLSIEKSMKIIKKAIMHSLIGTFLMPYCYAMESKKPIGKSMHIGEMAEAKYFFHQQLNDMCMIAPMLNLQLLKQMKNRDGTHDLNKVSRYSRREWMALNIPHLLRWHGILESLNHPMGKMLYPNVVKIIENAKIYGPVFPHFYDAKGNLLLSKNIFNVISETLLTPYLLIDFEAVKRFQLTIFGIPSFYIGDLGPALGLYLPIFKDKGISKFKASAVTGEYPHQKVEFDAFELAYKKNNEPDLSQFKDPKYWEMNLLTGLSVNPANFLGFDKIIKANNIARGYLSDEIKVYSGEHRYEVQSEAKKTEFLTFSLGLYKLMLLTLGIMDCPTTYNDQFSSQEQMLLIKQQQKILEEIAAGAAEELNTYVKQDSKLVWNPKYFSKEDFLQHAVAQILIKSPELFAEAKIINDFHFPLWSTYDKYLNLMASGKCFNYAHQRYYMSLAKIFLPSEEYAMAYGLTQNAWLLSIGAINSEAFYKALTNGTGFIRGMAIGTIWSSYTKNAYKKQIIPGSDKSLSYMDFWKKITHKLFEKYGNKSWISFSGHGMIISFEKDLIDKQKAIKNGDPALLNDLGFVIIDSWLGAELNTFYKQ